MANPCFYVAWTAGATIAGGGTLAGANARAIAGYAVDNYPSLINSAIVWLQRLTMFPKGGVISNIVTYGPQQVKSACSQLGR